MQLLLFPNSIPDEDDENSDAAPKGPQLPKVRITSSPEELRAAFNVAERLGKQEAQEAVASQSDNTVGGDTSSSNSIEMK